MQNFIPLSTEAILNNVSDLILRERLLITLFASISSTNDYLKKAYVKDENKIHLCLAEQQTAGRGRTKNKRWHSPFGYNIYFSCTWNFNKNINDLSALTLVVALAIHHTLGLNHISDLQIKWPNDIYWNNKKLSGSLIEVISASPANCKVVIGIGINANMMNDDQAEITQPWCSLQQILQHPIDRNKLIAELMLTLSEHLSRYETEHWQAFALQWQARDYLLGKQVQLNAGNTIITGIARGVNDKGQLLIESAEGHVEAFSVGEIFLKIFPA